MDTAATAATPLGTWFDALADAGPNDVLLTCGEDVVTRREFARNTNRLARAYAELGVTAGSMVTIALPNSVEFFEATVAVWKLGAVPQPVSHRLPPPELDAIVRLADPSLTVGLEAVDGRAWWPAGQQPDARLSDAPMPPIVSPCFKAPTSGGSTGRPKIIMSTTPGVAELVLAGAASTRIVDGEVLLCTGPLYHNMPFFFSLVALLRGGRVIIMPQFDASSCLRLADAHRVTYLLLVPTMLSRICRLSSAERIGCDLSALRIAFHLGAPCPPHIKRAWIDWIGAERILEVYAGTEGQAATSIWGSEWLDHQGSVGRFEARCAFSPTTDRS